MERRLIALAVAALLPAAHAAPPAPPAAVPAPAAAAPAATAKPVAPLLWKVSGGQHTIYLLGSFHLLKADDAPVGPAVEAAFADAEAVVFEVPPAELTDPANAPRFQKAMMFANGRTLSKTLPPATLAKLEKLLAPSKTPVAALDAFEPWAVSLQLAMGVMQALGFTPEQGLDKQLMARAAAAKKPVSGLETVDDQLRALDGTPEAEQIASLDKLASDPQKAVKDMVRLHQAWRGADIAVLDAGFRSEMERDTPASYKLMNVDRNARWVPKLEARLKAPGDDDTLVVVGALHLLGKDGLVERLRAKGYAVERMAAQ